VVRSGERLAAASGSGGERQRLQRAMG